MVLDLQAEAQANLEKLRGITYVGRGIVMGTSEDGQTVFQVYWISGRSSGSRNRVFVSDMPGEVHTAPAVPSEISEAEANRIIYTAMKEENPYFAVSNGKQTDDMLSGVCRGYTLMESLDQWEFEDDDPTFTSRISGVIALTGAGQLMELALLRKSRFGHGCDRFHYEYPVVERGFGYCITTYTGDGDPLPAFTGEPILVPLSGNLEEIANTYWEALDARYRVSLAVKAIDLHGNSQLHIINHHAVPPGTK